MTQNRNDYIEDYLSYVKWLVVGWLIGLLIGKIFDSHFGFGNPVFEGITRFIAGFGDTMGGVVGIIFFRLKNKRKSQAETFAIGTVIGTLAAPLLHCLIIILGLNPQGAFGFVYAVAYSNADNWGGVLFTLKGLIKKYHFKQGLAEFKKNVFVFANLIVLILLALLGFILRGLGFIPHTYFYSAIEGVILNNDSTLSVIIFYIWMRLHRKKHLT